MTSEHLLYALVNIESEFIEEAEKAYETGKLPIHKSYAKYMAIATVLTIVLLGAMRPAVLAEAAQAVIQWFEDHVSYRFRTENTTKSVNRYQLQIWEKGYRLVDEEYSGTFGSASYQSMEQGKMVYFLYGLSGGEVQIPIAHPDYKLIVDTDGTELHYIFPAAEEQEASLTWSSSDEQIVFSISGVLSEEELLELRCHVVRTGDGPLEFSETEGQLQGFERILAELTAEQAYAVWRPESEHPILLVAELGTYETDGVNGAVFCQVYGLRDGSPEYQGNLVCGGTAYPLRWDGKYIYTAWQHSMERYCISEQTGTLVLSDGICYIPAEGNYRIRRDAAIEEIFDENGEPSYISGGEWMDEESGETLLLKLEEEARGAEVIRFIPYIIQ